MIGAALVLVFPLASGGIKQLYIEKRIDILQNNVVNNGDLMGELQIDGERYLKIPVMHVSLPVYYGATEENMAKGAVVYVDDSPCDNLIIAAHRGYHGEPFFRDIEELCEGDEVYLISEAGTICYRVFQILVIEPDDSDALHLYEGKDILTLFTCHPYASHGRYRYVVYCSRETEKGSEKEPDRKERGKTAVKSIPGALAAKSSKGRIRMEMLLRICALFLILLMFSVICKRRKIS